VDTEALTVIVETPGNLPPTADAGPDAAAVAGALVTLNGTASADPVDGDPVTGFGTGLLAFWRQTSGPVAVLSDASAASPTFTPAIGGVYVFELVVGDGASLSASDVVVVTATGGLVGGGGAVGGGGSSGGGCGLTGFEVLLLLALRRRRHMGCAAAR